MIVSVKINDRFGKFNNNYNQNARIDDYAMR